MLSNWLRDIYVLKETFKRDICTYKQRKIGYLFFNIYIQINRILETIFLKKSSNYIITFLMYLTILLS